MKRLGSIAAIALLLVAMAPVVAFAAGSMPPGTLLPMGQAEGDPPIVVTVGEELYGGAAWAGFTRGIVQNAPAIMGCTFQVTGPSGEVINVEGAEAAAGWTGELWDPATCDVIGELTPFNPHLGAAPYMMGWFTPSFDVEQAGTYTVHSTITQKRPAPDLLSWGPDVKRHLVCMPAFYEMEYTFTAVMP